ncbi:hypothetical protein PACTADRAFT_74485 [Pachysolen tannophilus NRRL Y-2460]|uniref:Uncharacterized protein n=1 Tax=Pachysolen tannophilus NRRL Y-2460 TaxID=669874 RepID=A0A1E4TYQ7_PACTA|nr:hypothetical protein PACTADRAFT_74485 [Pachysolen tannophilus NRRL Y-2460]
MSLAKVESFNDIVNEEDLKEKDLIDDNNNGFEVVEFENDLNYLLNGDGKDKKMSKKKKKALKKLKALSNSDANADDIDFKKLKNKHKKVSVNVLIHDMDDLDISSSSAEEEDDDDEDEDDDAVVTPSVSSPADQSLALSKEKFGDNDSIDENLADQVLHAEELKMLEGYNSNDESNTASGSGSGSSSSSSSEKAHHNHRKHKKSKKIMKQKFDKSDRNKLDANGDVIEHHGKHFKHFASPPPYLHHNQHHEHQHHEHQKFQAQAHAHAHAAHHEHKHEHQMAHQMMHQMAQNQMAHRGHHHPGKHEKMRVGSLDKFGGGKKKEKFRKEGKHHHKGHARFEEEESALATALMIPSDDISTNERHLLQEGSRERAEILLMTQKLKLRILDLYDSLEKSSKEFETSNRSIDSKRTVDQLFQMDRVLAHEQHIMNGVFFNDYPDSEDTYRSFSPMAFSPPPGRRHGHGHKHRLRHHRR